MFEISLREDGCSFRCTPSTLELEVESSIPADYRLDLKKVVEVCNSNIARAKLDVQDEYDCLFLTVKEKWTLNPEKGASLTIPIATRTPISLKVNLENLTLECDEKLRRQIEIFNTFVKSAGLRVFRVEAKDGKIAFSHFKNCATVNLLSGTVEYYLPNTEYLYIPLNATTVGGEAFVVQDGFLLPFAERLVYDVKADTFHYPDFEFGNRVVEFWKKVKNQGLRPSRVVQKRTIEVLREKGDDEALSYCKRATKIGKRLSEKVKDWNRRTRELYHEFVEKGFLKVGEYTLIHVPFNSKNYLIAIGKEDFRVLEDHYNYCWPTQKREVKKIISRAEKYKLDLREYNRLLSDAEAVKVVANLLKPNDVKVNWRCMRCNSGNTIDCCYRYHAEEVLNRVRDEISAILSPKQLKTIAVSLL